MKEFKYWINAYSEVDGEYSNGFKNATEAFIEYDEQLEKIKKDGGNIEFLEVVTIASYERKLN